VRRLVEPRAARLSSVLIISGDAVSQSGSRRNVAYFLAKSGQVSEDRGKKKQCLERGREKKWCRTCEYAGEARLGF
jgi:hypothetical protein